MTCRRLSLCLLSFLVISPPLFSDEPERIIVKFKEDSGVRLRPRGLIGPAGTGLETLRSLIAPHAPRRLFRAKSESRYEAETRLRRQRKPKLTNRNLYIEIVVSDPDAANDLLTQLRQAPLVELAYLDRPPVLAAAPDTPDFEPLQMYLDEVPGIDARFAQTIPGGKGLGVKVIDLEYSWNFAHEDLLLDPSHYLMGPANNITYINHGTAVAGILVAIDDGYGTTGIVPEAWFGTISFLNVADATAIDAAASYLGRGDIMLLEAQTPGPPETGDCWDLSQDGCAPIEWEDANFAAIENATAAGIIVVEPAGNGGNDLDDPVYGGLFDRTVRDSGATMVGAGSPDDHSRLDFSNFGSRLDLQGWGSDVVTTGYGTFANLGTNRTYTATFRGTSSGSAIVAGAIAAMQGIIRNANFDIPMQNSELLDLLASTGTPQTGDTGQIGPLPNLKAASLTLLGDADGDEFPDPFDNCPLLADPDQSDNDNDGLGNPCDSDDDNDQVDDTTDNCPLIPNGSQLDRDCDGIGDACDSQFNGRRRCRPRPHNWP